MSKDAVTRTIFEAVCIAGFGAMSVNDPLVSIIIPVYNAAVYVRDAVNSALRQEYRHFEVIVVDDGSTDNTLDVLRDFPTDQVRILRQANSGPAAARNTALAYAAGEFIAFLDADDIWRRDKLRKQVNYMRIHPEIAVLHTDAEQFYLNSPDRHSYFALHSGVRDSDDLLAAMIAKFDIPLLSTVMIRAQVLSENGIAFVPEAGEICDLGLLFEVLAHGGVFAFLDEKLVLRRMHDTNMSRDYLRRFNTRIVLYQDLLSRYSHVPAAWKRCLKWGLSDAYFRVGEWYWGQADMENARTHFRKAIDTTILPWKASLYFLCTFFPTPLLSFMRRMKSEFYRTDRID